MTAAAAFCSCELRELYFVARVVEADDNAVALALPELAVDGGRLAGACGSYAVFFDAYDADDEAADDEPHCIIFDDSFFVGDSYFLTDS